MIPNVPQEKYLVPSPGVSPEKTCLLPTALPEVNADDQWAIGSSELLSGLTDDDRKLVGCLVPWDPWIYQQLFFPKAAEGKWVRRLQLNG